MCFVAMSCALNEIWHVLWLGVLIGAERRRGLLIHCAASCALLRRVLCGDVMRFEIWHVLWLGMFIKFIGAERRRGLLIHCAASCALLRHVLCVVV